MKSNSHLSKSVGFDRRRWLPVEATRCTLGIIFIVGIALFYKNPGAGALASIGALYTGMAGSSGVYHARIRAMAASGLFIGLATGLGVVVGSNEFLALISVLLVAFCTAMYASAGRAAATVGAQTTAILCVVIGLRLEPSGALSDALIVFGGAAVQLLLLTLIWPIRESLPERVAVAEAFEGLARFVRALPEYRETDGPQIPASIQIQDARQLLSEAERLHWREEHDVLFEALRRAEALRAALVGFAQADRAFASVNPTSKVRADRILGSVAGSLSQIADRARRGTLLGPTIILKIPQLNGASLQANSYRLWLRMLASLIADSCQPPKEVRLNPAPSNMKSIFSALTKLPDIEAVRSVTIQHALRYAITVELAFAISQHWARTHSFWLPLTVALVLRQDYGSTFQRGIARLAGTLIGLAVSGLILQVFHPTVLALQIITIGMTWLAFASILASYTFATSAITGFVVFSIAASENGISDVTSMRLIASLFGILLAVLSYVLWPAWKWSQIWDTFRVTAEAQSAYCEMVLKVHAARLHNLAEPVATEAEIDEARSQARALRIQSENLLEAVKVHPRGLDSRFLKFAGDASQTLEENAATILAAQAGWNTSHPETDELLTNALQASRALVTQLNEGIR